MTREKRIYLLCNIVYVIGIIVVASKLDLLSENLSSLALTTRGYFLLLLGGVVGATIIGYATSKIHNKLFAILTSISVLLCCVIPQSSIPSSLLANVHMICACSGLLGTVILTIININYFSKEHYNLGRILRDVFVVCVIVAVVLYMNFMMVTTLAELIFTFSLIIIYGIMFIKKDNT